MPEPTIEETFVFVAKATQTMASQLLDKLATAVPFDRRFKYIIGRIVMQLIAENRRVALLPNTTVAEWAWGTRNLLELRIWARYICASDSNAERFEGDMAVDSKETADAMVELYKVFKVEFESLPDLPNEIAASHSEMGRIVTDLNLKGKGHLSVSKIAELVRLKKEFDAMNRLTSKLVHPTALSLLGKDLESPYHVALVGNGIMLASKTVIDLTKHVDECGVFPRSVEATKA